MLKQRLITALILLPLAILGILFLPFTYFKILTMGLFIVAAFEWSKLIGLKSHLHQLIYVFILCGLTWLGSAYFISFHIKSLTLLITFFWVLIIPYLYLYPKFKMFWASKLVGMIIGFILISGTWYSLLYFAYPHSQFSRGLLLYVMCLVWGADSGAYFMGKYLGKHKLIEKVSPGKTIEGVFGALLSSIPISLIGHFYFKAHFHLYASLLLLSLGTVLLSIVGDLFESLYKRVRGVKDSGHILPGHGGILDRIDSLTAALPVFIALYFI
ncbi:MAG: phosphatidate cytidylyltransferase [Francisellaceae bacterium]|nr:phosphatidate cytidylyltransferase [Francisellaceae bacterium]